MGMVRGYVVGVPGGRILKLIGEAELKRNWRRYLGYRFR
jgi:hypothetical protein